MVIFFGYFLMEGEQTEVDGLCGQHRGVCEVLIENVTEGVSTQLLLCPI